MTSSIETESKSPDGTDQSVFKSSISRYWLCFGGGLTVLAFSLFVLTPFLNRAWGETAGNSAFMILRLVGWMALGFFFTRWVKSTRFQAVMATVILSMIDSVVLKGIVLLNDRKLHPQNWEGIEPSTLIFGLAMSSVLFLPIVLMLSFMGCLIGTADKKSANKNFQKPTAPPVSSK